MRIKHFFLSILLTLSCHIGASLADRHASPAPRANAQDLRQMISKAFKFIDWKELPSNIKESYRESKKEYDIVLKRKDRFWVALTKRLLFDKINDPKEFDLPMDKSQFDYIKQEIFMLFPSELKRTLKKPFPIARIGLIIPSISIPAIWVLRVMRYINTVLAIIATVLMLILLGVIIIAKIITEITRIGIALMRSQERFVEKIQRQQASLGAPLNF